MNDPMGQIPKDHGSDRYNHVEIHGPPEIEPSGTWWTALLETPCPDCNANLFVTWIGGHSAGGSSADPRVRENWHVATAHDDGCPTMAKFIKKDDYWCREPIGGGRTCNAPGRPIPDPPTPDRTVLCPQHRLGWGREL